VSFTLVHTGKYTRQIKHGDNTKTKHNPENANNAKTQQNKTILVQ